MLKLTKSIKLKNLSRLKYLAIGIIIGSLLSMPIAQASNVVKLVVNGEDITYKSDVPPQIINGRTLVPARALAESLGASVEWDGENRAVVVESIKDVDNTQIMKQEEIINPNNDISNIPPLIIDNTHIDNDTPDWVKSQPSNIFDQIEPKMN